MQEKTNDLTFSNENYILFVKKQNTSHFGIENHITKDNNECFKSSSVSTTIYWVVCFQHRNDRFLYGRKSVRKVKFSRSFWREEVSGNHIPTTHTRTFGLSCQCSVI